MRDRRGYVLAAAALVVGLVAACAAAPAPSTGGQGPAPAGTQPRAPDFAFTTFAGDPIGPAELKGRAVVLNFWASWCTPCRAEMPYFEKTYRAFKDRGVVFVGLAVQDDPDSAALFRDELGITYPTGPDEDEAVAKRYQVRGLPTTVFIGHDGKIAARWTGALSEQQLVAFVERLAG